MLSRPGALALSCLVVAALACDRTGDAGGAAAAPAPASGAIKGGGAGGPGGAPGGGAPGAAGRGPSAVVLGPGDVAVVRTGLVEEAIQISGVLRPIEEIAVRARIEGDIVGVFAREGDRVTRGALLARFEAAVQEGDRASALADREAARSDVANAQWNAEQAAELLKAGAIPERDVRAAQQVLAAAGARLAATEARLRSSEQSAQDTRIVAPTNGVVAARSVEDGEHVSRGTTLFTVVRNDVLELEAAVPARQAGALKEGQAVRFASSGVQLAGKVARIAPTINPANQSITVYVEIANPQGAIKGNSFATGRIVGRALAGVVLVPNSAVRQSQEGDKPFVYRIEGDVVQRQEVSLGTVDELVAMTHVVEGLKAGDRIVVGNLGTLGAGMRVRVVTAGEGRGAAGARSAQAAPGAAGTPRAGDAPGRRGGVPKAGDSAVQR